ncbi:hypothetical protein [Lactiplantibacillus modestisalitolerans]|uniref:Uncharacterized protein n=1 Tax=Lactiplantibacillus modestisalitolerans TaxID=1457219 RepID=A0ABV5WV95_9LACO|nr:hypothetical protein [Lactiplantibacillus modestisalitolerans]
MQKHVAGTIINSTSAGLTFLVKRTSAGSYEFYNLPVMAEQSPLASVLWQLRHKVGIDVDQLRLYDSTIAELNGEKVSVFVFNHLELNPDIRKRFEQFGLFFVPSSALHDLFTRVHVGKMPVFSDLENKSN